MIRDRSAAARRARGSQARYRRSVGPAGSGGEGDRHTSGVRRRYCRTLWLNRRSFCLRAVPLRCTHSNTSPRHAPITVTAVTVSRELTSTVSGGVSCCGGGRREAAHWQAATTTHGPRVGNESTRAQGVAAASAVDKRPQQQFEKTASPTQGHGHAQAGSGAQPSTYPDERAQGPCPVRRLASPARERISGELQPKPRRQQRNKNEGTRVYRVTIRMRFWLCSVGSMGADRSDFTWSVTLTPSAVPCT